MNIYCFHCMNRIVEGNVCSSCGSTNTCQAPLNYLAPGTVLNRKYYIGEALGEGGFGITYVGRDINLDIKVAIKEFYPFGYVNRDSTDSPCLNSVASVERESFFEKGKKKFLEEAQTLVKCSDEQGIVNVHDFFEENNTVYIVMEFLDGKTLKKYIDENSRMSPEETLEKLNPIINSLNAIHKQGLIHRDISPDNIMICNNKSKLLDFGAARTVLASENKSLSIMLKPGYAPEEQYRSKGAQGPWTDIYALCATMYKCITGITPDDATQRVHCDDLKKPSELGVNISSALENAILKGMSIYQKDRFQSVDELLAAFEHAENCREDDDCTKATVLGESIDPMTGLPENITKNDKQKNAKLISIIASVLVVALIVGVVSFLGIKTKSDKENSENLPQADNIVNSDKINRINKEFLSDKDYKIVSSGCAMGLYTIGDADYITDMNGIHKYTPNEKITLVDKKTTSNFSIVKDKIYYGAEDKVVTISDSKKVKYSSCWRMNLDGSDKEKMFDYNGCGFVIYIDDDFIYYADDGENYIKNNRFSSYHLYRFNLKTQEKVLIDNGITQDEDGNKKANTLLDFTYSYGNIFYCGFDGDVFRYDIKENTVSKMNFILLDNIMLKLDNENIAFLVRKNDEYVLLLYNSKINNIKELKTWDKRYNSPEIQKTNDNVYLKMFFETKEYDSDLKESITYSKSHYFKCIYDKEWKIVEENFDFEIRYFILNEIDRKVEVRGLFGVNDDYIGSVPYKNNIYESQLDDNLIGKNIALFDSSDYVYNEIYDCIERQFVNCNEIEKFEKIKLNSLS